MKPQDCPILIVEAGVRYWEDATVNEVADTDGTLIPFRDGDLWKPKIKIATGQVIDWPIGTTANIHYKVCDAGEYWLGDSDGKKVWKWNGSYVPDRILCPIEGGYGDYIIMTINRGGLVDYWHPHIQEESWSSV